MTIRITQRAGLTALIALLALAQGACSSEDPPTDDAEMAEILEENRTDQGIHLHLRMAPGEWNRLRSRYRDRAPGIFSS